MTEERRDQESAPLIQSVEFSGISTSASVSLPGDVESTGPAEKLRTYWWRWLVLAEFVVLLAVNNALWITFGPIADVMTCYYDTSDFWINSLSMIYMATYFVFVIPSALLVSRLGLRTTVIMAACANAAGACLRWAGSAPNLYWLLLFGQAVASICSVFIWGAPALLSSIWFPPSERGTATSLAAGIAPQIGVLVMYAITPVIVRSDLTAAVCNSSASPDSALHAQWSNEIYTQFSYLLLVQAGISLLLIFPALFAFPSAPPTPPSTSRKLEDSLYVADSTHFWLIIKSILQNYHFLLLLVTAGISLAASGAVVTVANEIVLAYFNGYEEQIGFLGLTAEVSAIVALLIMGRLLDWTKAYYGLSVLVYFGSAGALAAFAASVQFQHHFVVLYVVIGLAGGILTSFQAIAYEFAVELTYPLPEGISGGLINWSAEVFAIIMIVVVGQVSPKHVPIGTWFITGLVFAGALLTVFLRPNLRRIKVDNPEIVDHSETRIQNTDVS